MQEQFLKIHKNPKKEMWDTDWMYVNISKIILLIPVLNREIWIVRIDNDYVQYFADKKEIENLKINIKNTD